MRRRITITLGDEVLRWVRSQATDDNTSVSKVIGRLLENERSKAYWRAYEEWKKLSSDLGAPIDASKRFTRDEAHERR